MDSLIDLSVVLGPLREPSRRSGVARWKAVVVRVAAAILARRIRIRLLKNSVKLCVIGIYVVVRMVRGLSVDCGLDGRRRSIIDNVRGGSGNRRRVHADVLGVTRS
eukprot:3738751-Pleurochrysis_carterae.AAC.1